MKAFLLAAGLGTRLRPITDEIPKCLVPICGKPLLEWWIDLFEKHDIDEVLINLHHIPDKVINHISSIKTKVKFHFSYEKKLLGSAGTLRENKDFIIEEEHFFVLYADNLTNINLTEFLNFFKCNNQPAALALFETDQPKSKGIVELDKNNLVISFEEKPEKPRSNLANSGIYIFKPEIINFIPDSELADIGFHLLPKLVHHMVGWKINDFLIDIGTHQHLSIAQKKWEKIIKGENYEI